MAKSKTINLAKLKETLKKTEASHKDWKTSLTKAINDGEHKTADAAVKLIAKSRDSLHKLLSHVESHSAKKQAKMANSAAKSAE